jgi:hypothetical protein
MHRNLVLNTEVNILHVRIGVNENNIKMDLKVRVYRDMDLINLTQEREKRWGSCEHCNHPSHCINNEELLNQPSD